MWGSAQSRCAVCVVERDPGAVGAPCEDAECRRDARAGCAACGRDAGRAAAVQTAALGAADAGCRVAAGLAGGR